jgi:hypothetical protein
MMGINPIDEEALKLTVDALAVDDGKDEIDLLNLNNPSLLGRKLKS